MKALWSAEKIGERPWVAEILGLSAEEAPLSMWTAGFSHVRRVSGTAPAGRPPHRRSMTAEAATR